MHTLDEDNGKHDIDGRQKVVNGNKGEEGEEATLTDGKSPELLNAEHIHRRAARRIH